MIDKKIFLETHGWEETYGGFWIRSTDDDTKGAEDMDRAFYYALRELDWNEYSMMDEKTKEWVMKTCN